MNMSISDNLLTVSSIEEEEYISTQEFKNISVLMIKG